MVVVVVASEVDVLGVVAGVEVAKVEDVVADVRDVVVGVEDGAVDVVAASPLHDVSVTTNASASDNRCTIRPPFVSMVDTDDSSDSMHGSVVSKP